MKEVEMLLFRPNIPQRAQYVFLFKIIRVSSRHYENLPMQCTEIFFSEEKN